MFKGSIPALVTPFTPEGMIDFFTLEELIEWHIACGTDALVVCGVTGEAPTLTPQEQREIIITAVKTAKERIPIIAGTGTASTQLTLYLTEQAKQVGAEACLVIVPYCNRPTPQGCLKHYETISKIGLPLIVYHHPSRTNVRLPITALCEILSLPHIVGIKEGSADLAYTNELVKMTDTPIFCGDDILALSMLSIGAQGVISIVANIIPKEWQKFCALLLEGDILTARELFRFYQELIQSMTLEVNPQCIKYALSLMNKCSSSLRLPLVEPEPEIKRKIEQAVKRISKAFSEITI